MQEHGLAAASVGEHVDVGVCVALETQLQAVAGAQRATVTKLEFLRSMRSVCRPRHHPHADFRDGVERGPHAGRMHARDDQQDGAQQHRRRKNAESGPAGCAFRIHVGEFPGSQVSAARLADTPSADVATGILPLSGPPAQDCPAGAGEGPFLLSFPV